MSESDGGTQISLKLSKVLHEALVQRAELLNLRKSRIFRQALETYLLPDTTALMPKQIVVQVRFVAQLIKCVDSLDAHRELIQQEMEVLLCLVAENSPS